MNAAGPTKRHSCCAPRTASIPMTIVFVQCVGSRDTSGCGKAHTAPRSAACTPPSTPCSTREKYPDTDVYVFYIDVRTPGKNFDEFYRRAVEQYGVHYIKGMVGKVVPQADGKLLVQASDLIGERAAAYRCGSGRAGRGHRAG